MPSEMNHLRVMVKTRLPCGDTYPMFSDYNFTFLFSACSMPCDKTNICVGYLEWIDVVVSWNVIFDI